MEEDGEDGGGGSMRRKAVKALKTLRANMPAALAKGVAEKGLEEKDVENFLDLVYDKMDCDNAFGDLLQQVAVNEGMDVNMWIRGYVDMAVVETLWADIGAAAVQADIDANSKSHVCLTIRSLTSHSLSQSSLSHSQLPNCVPLSGSSAEHTYFKLQTAAF